MVLTIPQIIEVAKVCGYLAANDIAKGSFGKEGLDKSLNIKIYTERRAVEWMYDNDPTNTTLPGAAYYLYALCAPYSQKALLIINGGGGGIPVSPVTPTPSAAVYPFIITSADFESDGISYNNPEIVGDSLSIFVNEYSQQWLVASGSTFSYTATGIIINIPDFDANTYTYTIMVQKLNS